MRPTLFELFGERFPSYFTLLFVGFFVCTWITSRIGARRGIDPSLMIDLGFFSLIMAVVGSRIGHVLFDGFFLDYVNLCVAPEKVVWPFDEARCASSGGRWELLTSTCHPASRDCLAWAAVWRGGLTYYGGLALAVPFAAYFFKKHGIPVWRGIDTIAIVLPLGVAFGRAGCYLAGCCFGEITDSPLGLSFPPYSPASEKHALLELIPGAQHASLPVWPTQLFELFGCVAIFLYLWLYREKRSRFDGWLTIESLGLYAVLRFALEFIRDDERGIYFGLSTSQWLSIGVVIFCAWIYVVRTKPRGETQHA
jgi:phosphatidylglycerol---prolipoprotein diacylglyceryl transferase